MKILEKIKRIKKINPKGTYQVIVDTDDMMEVQKVMKILQRELPQAKLILTPERIKLKQEKKLRRHHSFKGKARVL